MSSGDELLLEIAVLCEEPCSVRGNDTTVVMIPFTGTADSPCFKGRTVGTGVDTQKIGSDGSFMLSARYMLEGADAAGSPCRIFIENQGSAQAGFIPRIVTDSPLLKDWETADLYSTVDGAPGGVTVRIYRR